VLASRTKIFIVIELVTGGELFDRIVAAGRLEENQARFYFRQVKEQMFNVREREREMRLSQTIQNQIFSMC
jgi:hypothetical protein